MPTVTHQRKYQRTLTSDTYQISVACCSDFREMSDPSWKKCPYCGESITIEELQEITEES